MGREAPAGAICGHVPLPRAVRLTDGYNTRTPLTRSGLPASGPGPAGLKKSAAHGP